MIRLRGYALLALVAAQLGGCSSCVKDEEQPPKKPIEARDKQPSLSSKHRMRIHQVDASDSDAAEAQ